MSEFERLKDMIAKLRAKGQQGAGGRGLSGADAAGRLAALLQEVNETILPRRLILRWDDGDGIQLAVANRRLQGVLAPSAGALGALAGQPLSDPEEAVTQKVRDALLDLLDKAEGAQIQSVHLGQDDLGSDAGLSAEALLREWGLADRANGGTGKSDALPAFLAAMSKSAIAWLSVEGEDVADQHGDEADIARLGESAAYLLDAYLNGKDALFGGDTGPCAFAVSSADQGVFFADTGTHTVFVLTAPDRLVEAATAWRTSFG